MRALLLSFTAIIVLCCVGVPFVYFDLGGFNGPLSDESSDWSHFGDFIGGVIGPILSFFSTVLLIITVRQQYDANEIARKEQLAAQHIRLLGDLLAEIKTLMDEPIRVKQGGAESLKTVLRNQLTAEPASSETISELVFLAFRYCEAVALYRDNVTEHFDCKAYEMQGSRLIEQLRKNIGLIDERQRIQLEFADMHIRNEKHRRRPVFS